MEFQSSWSGPEGPFDGWDDWDEPGLSEDDYLAATAPLNEDDGPLPEWDSDGELIDDSAPARFDRALDRLRSAADELVRLRSDPELVLADRDRLIGWTRDLEHASNKLQAPEQSLINLMEAAGCRIDGPLGLFASPQAFLVALLGIPWRQARARVAAARLLAPTVQPTGARLGARYPVLAEAQASGEISADRIDQVITALTEWQKLLDVDGNDVTLESLKVAEESLARQARVFGGAELGKVIARIGDYLCPDGMVDDRPAQEAVRSFELTPVSRGLHKGMYRAEGWVTAETGAKAVAVLDPLSKPQPVVDEHGDVVEPDRRDRGMRMHDALDEVLDRALHSGDLPAHGGTPATLILTAAAEEVVAGTGTGMTEIGDRLPMDSIIALADEAEIVRTVFGKETREVLYLGRSRRLASYPQTLALVARDGGCTFPGCTKSPKWCQRHHIVDWVKGGSTDLPNLTLLCPFHHYRFARHGWSAEYRDGRVWWRPPKIIDPDQKPILNIRHRPGSLTG